MSTDHQFADAAGRLMQTVAEHLDREQAGVVCDIAGDVLTLRMPDGIKCTLIRQTPTRQVWLSEGVLAWYFDHVPETGGWVDGRGRGPLRTILQDMLARHLGRSVPLPVP